MNRLTVNGGTRGGFATALLVAANRLGPGDHNFSTAVEEYDGRRCVISVLLTLDGECDPVPVRLSCIPVRAC